MSAVAASWKANGRAPRHIVTLAGEVGLSRRRYRCGACGHEIVPLDELLGLEPRAQHTLGVRERALFLVTELSYAKAARTLDELRGLGVSHGQLHGWVKEEGRRIEAETAARTEAVLGAHPERGSTGRMPGDVWVSADGTMVHDRGSGTHMEVKLGLVFTGTGRTGRHRRALLDRHLVGATGSWATFAERFTAACAVLGVYEAERSLFVSDGAAAIRSIRERSFPDAIELLDWYHLSEQLRFGIGRQHEAVLSTALGAAARDSRKVRMTSPSRARVGFASGSARLRRPTYASRTSQPPAHPVACRACTLGDKCRRSRTERR
jgi:hypothetical protein